MCLIYNKIGVLIFITREKNTGGLFGKVTSGGLGLSPLEPARWQGGVGHRRRSHCSETTPCS